MEPAYHSLASQISHRYTQSQKQRYLVAIAGAPGSGKTTTAKRIVSLLNEQHGPDTAICIPMDGFHYPRSYLDRLPNKDEAYTRRGAPWTFDAEKVVQLVRRLRESADSPSNSKKQEIIKAPSFSHSKKDPIPSAIPIPPSIPIILLEGNYLLLNQQPWLQIAPLVDLKIFIDADLEVVRERVARRHVRSGIEGNLEDAYRRVDRNDYLNGVLVKEKCLEPDIRVVSVEEGG
ncbi:MAG: putative kinase [Cirrosporium novae-zelandiae]|nr:MAG: putative kinase [Cirrosporium novae-zelandiae]